MATAAPATIARAKPGSLRLGPWLPYLLIAPSVVLLVSLIAYPLIFALKNSFYFWNLQRSPDPLMFVGFANSEDLSAGVDRQTVAYRILSGPDFDRSQVVGSDIGGGSGSRVVESYTSELSVVWRDVDPEVVNPI